MQLKDYHAVKPIYELVVQSLSMAGEEVIGVTEIAIKRGKNKGKIRRKKVMAIDLKCMEPLREAIKFAEEHEIYGS